MIKYEMRNPEGNTARQLIELSRLWVEEDCSYGMIVNEADDLTEPLAIALEDEKIVGYIFGHFYQQKTKTSTARHRPPESPSPRNLPSGHLFWRGYLFSYVLPRIRARRGIR